MVDVHVTGVFKVVSIERSVPPELIQGRESDARPLVDVPGGVSRTVLLDELLDQLLLDSDAALDILIGRGNPDLPGGVPAFLEMIMINHT